MPSLPSGERFQGSNAGFIVPGAIIEQASAQAYFDHVRTHIYAATSAKANVNKSCLALK